MVSLRHHELALFGGLLRWRILTMLSGVCGLLEVTLMASKRRKEPDAVQAVRDWLEKTQKEFWVFLTKTAKGQFVSKPRSGSV